MRSWNMTQYPKDKSCCDKVHSVYLEVNNSTVTSHVGIDGSSCGGSVSESLDSFNILDKFSIPPCVVHSKQTADCSEFEVQFQMSQLHHYMTYNTMQKQSHINPDGGGLTTSFPAESRKKE